MIYVVAGTVQEFREWCRREGVMPSAVRHVGGRDLTYLNGLRICPEDLIVFYGATPRNTAEVLERLVMAGVGLDPEEIARRLRGGPSPSELAATTADLVALRRELD